MIKYTSDTCPFLVPGHIHHSIRPLFLMDASPRLKLTFTALFSAFVLIGASAQGAAPVVEAPSQVSPTIPAGKSLVIPVAGSDADGDLLSFKVVSSNPGVVVARVKTGNPILRIHVSYPGGTGVAAFEEDLEFQLFRDLAPITTGFIGGFAQAGYYDNQIFHRVIADFVAQGGDPAGNGTGTLGNVDVGLPFTFEHEFQPSLIFSGRGQLAMANSNGGYNRGGQLFNGILPTNRIEFGDFRATNGSQFFITFEKQRTLDFIHTIFGQLIRGWSTLDKIESVQTDGNNKPLQDVKMTSVTVVPGRAEATLTLAAKGVGSAIITVTATDPAGNSSQPVKFTAQAVLDTVDDVPILRPFASEVATVGNAQYPPLSDASIDLEFDPVSYVIPGVAQLFGNSTAAGQQGTASLLDRYTPRTTFGLQTYAIGVLQELDPNSNPSPTTVDPFAPYDRKTFQVFSLGYGDKGARAESVAIEAAPAVALAGVVVGKIYDLDPSSVSGDFAATINWGDGGALSTATVERDLTTPLGNQLVAKGGHTYAKVGVYPVVVTFTGNRGFVAVARSQAVVTAGAIRAKGESLLLNSGRVVNRELASFTDANSTFDAGSYSATIEWGDGLSSAGTILRDGSGRFSVRGTHGYVDSQAYSVLVRIHKGAATANDPVAWTTINATFNAPAHLPPFPQPRIVGLWRSGPTLSVKRLAGQAFQLELPGAFSIFSTGNRTAPPSKLRFWLSDDATLEKTGANKDRNVTVRLNAVASAFPQLFVPSIAAGVRFNGVGVTIVLPSGETGRGKFLLTEFDYANAMIPLSRKLVVAQMPVPMTVAPTGGLTTSESATSNTATFTVKLTVAPTADVTIPLQSSNVAEGTMSPSQLVFTTANFATAQTVTVTGVPDGVDDGNKEYLIRLGAAVSTDPYYSGLDGPDVSVTNTDIN